MRFFFCNKSYFIKMQELDIPLPIELHHPDVPLPKEIHQLDIPLPKELHHPDVIQIYVILRQDHLLVGEEDDQFRGCF